MDNYNYSKFKVDYYDMTKFNGPLAGEKAPDFQAIMLDGSETSLHKYLSKPVILELGSVTCPLFCQYLNRMNELAIKYTEFNFLVLYVREAHPGEKLTNHKSILKKIDAAKKLIELENEKRIILIDDIGGNAHKKYGSMPNSCFVINTAGVVQYTSDTTNHDLLEQFISDYSFEKKENKMNFDRFQEDRSGIFQAIKVMFRGGFSAILDFIKQLPQLFKMHKKLNAIFQEQQNSNGSK